MILLIDRLTTKLLSAIYQMVKLELFYQESFYFIFYFNCF